MAPAWWAMGWGRRAKWPPRSEKGSRLPRRRCIGFPLTDKGRTIPHTVTGRFGSGVVFLKPASEGTGVIAGGPVRAVLTAAGVQNVLTKNLGSPTPHNVVKATLTGLLNLKEPREVARLRGKSVSEILGLDEKEKQPEPDAKPAPATPPASVS